MGWKNWQTGEKNMRKAKFGELKRLVENELRADPSQTIDGLRKRIESFYGIRCGDSTIGNYHRDWHRRCKENIGNRPMSMQIEEPPPVDNLLHFLAAAKRVGGVAEARRILEAVAG